MVVKFKQHFVLFFLVISILGAFGLGVWFGKIQVVCPTCPVCKPEHVDFSLFWEAWQKLEEKYVGKENLDIQKMIYGAISGMVRSLEDPYTLFLTPDDTKTFIENVKGTFEGVGMEIGIRNGQLQVIAPLEGTPAQKAGLRAGDKIIKVDDKSTIDMTIEEAVNLIRGPKGTEVTLTIYRDEWNETKDIEIIRGVIEIPSLKLEFKEENIACPSEAKGEDGCFVSIAHLHLYHFSEKAVSDFNQAAIQILESDAKKIILDLRNNPGGYLEVAQNIAGWFLEKGEIVVIEDFGGKKEQEIYKAEGNSLFLHYPLVVLINEGSASGSEILAGALRDNRGIKLIGETSFGKGSVQELERLTGGSSLKITIAKWLTPTGSLITDKGLEPDIKVELTEEDYEQDRDPQLEKAIEIIKELN